MAPKQIIPESRTAQIDREIEGLVTGFAEKPNKQTSDSLYYLARERALLLSNKPVASSERFR